MSTLTFRAMGLAALPFLLHRFFKPLRSSIHRLAGIWRQAVARREYESLDPATLRDLGLSRGEFESYWAETHGEAERTRLRVIQGIRDRC